MPTLKELRDELMVIEQAMIVWPERQDYKRHHKRVKYKYDQKLRLNRVYSNARDYGQVKSARKQMDRRFRYLMDKE